MNTEYFTINNSCKNEEVKDLTAGFPDRGVSILLLALLIKPINLSYLTRLVISTNKSDLVRVPKLDMMSRLVIYTL